MATKKITDGSYAIVLTGGKQYMVRENDTLKVELLDSSAGDKVVLDQVLAVSDGKVLNVGTPQLNGAKVSCTVVDQIRDKKVINFKKKRRKGYSRKVGHRQNLTVLHVDKIK